jgi:alkylated DNA repair protein (DNA oxidative demethylase)
MGPKGFRFLPGRLGPQDQALLCAEVLSRLEAAPLYAPLTPAGKPMSVRMSNFGPLGWVTDAGGYRYAAVHPLTGRPWPTIPPMLVALWREWAGGGPDPDCCLVNVYGEGARMGLHQDRDEADFAFPVLSVSLGDTAVFRIGASRRGGPTRSVRLASGDVCLLEGPARLAFHGIDRVLSGSSRLAPGHGRINLTLRRAAPV